MAKKQIDLGLTGLDELFMDDKERAESKLPKIHEIPLSEIDEFPNHPFHVRLDEDMDQLVESIKERGIITPVTLRQKPDGRYEIVSGHRRTKACELAGLTTVKAEIKELSRDEAIILMVESNLQRTTILPSEKAFSYKMRLEAMNRQLEHSDSSISSRYTCSGDNPQKVTVSNGATTSVSFYNKLAVGALAIRKSTNTGNHLGGWKFIVKNSDTAPCQRFLLQPLWRGGRDCQIY